jgi:hypothetical protein
VYLSAVLSRDQSRRPGEARMRLAWIKVKWAGIGGRRCEAARPRRRSDGFLFGLWIVCLGLAVFCVNLGFWFNPFLMRIVSTLGFKHHWDVIGRSEGRLKKKS